MEPIVDVLSAKCEHCGRNDAFPARQRLFVNGMAVQSLGDEVDSYIVPGPLLREYQQLSELSGKQAQAREGSHEHSMQQFATGATRDDDDGKIDFEGFMSPVALERYGEFMLEHQIQSDGTKRASDNWQKGIPRRKYMKSLLRHAITAWKIHRGWPVKQEMIGGVLREPTLAECLCGVLFNTFGYLHELLIGRDIEG